MGQLHGLCLLETAPAHIEIRLASGRMGTAQTVFPWGIDCQKWRWNFHQQERSEIPKSLHQAPPKSM